MKTVERKIQQRKRIKKQVADKFAKEKIVKTQEQIDKNLKNLSKNGL